MKQGKAAIMPIIHKEDHKRVKSKGEPFGKTIKGTDLLKEIEEAKQAPEGYLESLS